MPPVLIGLAGSYDLSVRVGDQMRALVGAKGRMDKVEVDLFLPLFDAGDERIECRRLHELAIENMKPKLRSY